MIFLNEPTEQIKKEWSDKISKKVLDVLKIKTNYRYKCFIKKNLKTILIGTPREIFDLQLSFFKKVYKDKLAFDLDDFFSFLMYKNNKEDLRTKMTMPNDYPIYENYYHEIKILAEIFDYEKFVSNSKSLSYWLTDKLNIQCCPYCNRNYIFTVGNLNNDKNRIIRPDLDHYFPKSKFPLLALSIYNLIPSCSICNSNIKGSKFFDLSDSFHPYCSYNDYKFKFDYDVISYGNYNLKFNYSNDKIIEKHFKDFNLEEIYKLHSKFELKDIVNLSLKNSKNRLLEIKNLLKDDDLYYGCFGIDPKFISVNNNRPLSKLKYDIIRKNIDLL